MDHGNFIIFIPGWWLTYPSEKYSSVGMIIPNIWKNKKCSQATNQIHTDSFILHILFSKRLPQRFHFGWLKATIFGCGHTMFLPNTTLAEVSEGQGP